MARRGRRGTADPAAHLLRLVRTTNDYIARTHGEANMFATVFVAELDTATGSLVYVNAGHEAPVLVRAGGARERLSPSGPALGPVPEVVFEARSVTLAPGDGIVAFTDGVTHATRRALSSPRSGCSASWTPSASSASQQIDAIRNALGTHTQDAAPFDDITLLALRRQRSQG